MNRRLLLCAAGLVVVLIVGLLAAPAAAADTPELRYGFEEGKEYCYNVKITGEVTDRTSRYTGVLVFSAAKDGDSQFRLTSNSVLTAEHLDEKGQTVSLAASGPPMRHRGGPMWMGMSSRGTTFTRTGTVISTQSEEHLPFVLGLEHALIVEPLPEKPQASWGSETDIAVVERMSASPFFSRLRRFYTESQTMGKEAIKYAIVGQKDNIVRIKKTYSLQTRPDEGIVRFDMSGEGEFGFDAKRGVIQSLQMKYKIQVNEKNMALTIPVSVEYNLLSEAEMAARKQKQEEAMAAALEARKPKPLEPGEREALIAKLQSGNDADVRSAAERLAKAVPTAQKDDVARALIAVANSHATLTKKAVVQALAVWRVPEAEGVLISFLGDSDATFFSREAIAALAKFRTPAAAKAIAESMIKDHRRHEAAEALSAMGPIAEDATIPLLNDRDQWVRTDACRILGKIGGEKSLQALKHQLVDARDLSETHNLKRAIDTINQRGGKPPVMPEEKEEVAAEPVGPGSDAISRTWHDATHSFQVEAKLISMEGDKVTLLRSDGRTIALPLGKLCEEDQEFVKQHAKAENPFE